MQLLLHPFLVQLAFILLKVVCLLIAIAYYTIAERKIMAAIQRRRGPNVVGFWGLLQPLADGLKLIAKEMVIPSHSNSRIFVAAPLVILTLSLISWSIIPFGCVDIAEEMYGRGDKAEPIAIAVVIAVCVVLAISAIYVVDSSAATTGPTKAISERLTAKIRAKAMKKDLKRSRLPIRLAKKITRLISNDLKHLLKVVELQMFIMESLSFSR